MRGRRASVRCRLSHLLQKLHSSVPSGNCSGEQLQEPAPGVVGSEGRAVEPRVREWTYEQEESKKADKEEDPQHCTRLSNTRRELYAHMSGCETLQLLRDLGIP